MALRPKATIKTNNPFGNNDRASSVFRMLETKSWIQPAKIGACRLFRTGILDQKSSSGQRYFAALFLDMQLFSGLGLRALTRPGARAIDEECLR